MTGLEAFALEAFLCVAVSTIGLWYAHSKLAEAARLAEEDQHEADVKAWRELPDVAPSPVLADDYTPPPPRQPVEVRQISVPEHVTAEYWQIVTKTYGQPGEYGTPRPPQRSEVPLVPRRVVWVNEQPREPLPTWEQAALDVGIPS